MPPVKELGPESAEAVSTPLALTAIVLVAINLRPALVSVGPVLPSILAEFRLSHAAASLLTAIPVVFMGALSLPTPTLARRFGRDGLMLAALGLLLLSTAARGLAANTAELIVSAAGIGTGIAVASTLIAGFIKARFPDRAVRIMGVYATSLTIGSVISAAATGPVVAARWGGWRLAAGMWSVLCLAGIASWLILMLRERQHHRVVPAAPAAARLPLAHLTAWLVAVFFALQLFLFYAIVAWISPLYREAGLSSTVAAFILTTFTLAFLCGNSLLGWLSRSEDRRFWLALCSGVTLAGLVLLALAPGLAPFAWVTIIALGLGGNFTLAMTLPLDNARSAEESNGWNAFVLTFGFVVAAAGPLAVGRLRDLTGDFHLALELLAAVAAGMFLLTPFLQPHHHRRPAVS